MDGFFAFFSVHRLPSSVAEIFGYSKLYALLAVEEAGTFEAAARVLNLFSFAVVQRIKALEAQMDVTLVDRAPTRTSKAGKALWSCHGFVLCP